MGEKKFVFFLSAIRKKKKKIMISLYGFLFNARVMRLS